MCVAAWTLQAVRTVVLEIDKEQMEEAAKRVHMPV